LCLCLFVCSVGRVCGSRGSCCVYIYAGSRPGPGRVCHTGYTNNTWCRGWLGPGHTFLASCVWSGGWGVCSKAGPGGSARAGIPSCSRGEPGSSCGVWWLLLRGSCGGQATDLHAAVEPGDMYSRSRHPSASRRVGGCLCVVPSLVAHIPCDMLGVLVGA
jgi:hypothetical protein